VADDLLFASVAEQAAAFRSGEVSPVEVTHATLERIDRLDPVLHAFITIRRDEALEDARRAEAELRSGRVRSPLHGVTVAFKDQMLVQGLPLTGGSRVLEGAPSARDATVVARMRAAGAVVLGTLNTHEFHAGPTRVFPFGTPRNPWHLDHSPGGSSSGSASAVAAGLCTVTLGGDTGGSVRGPASACGVVGLKPTWSRVSRDGVIPLAPSLDAVGPLARRVDDVAAALAVIAGADPRDPTASHVPADAYLAAGGDDLTGLRVGVIEELMGHEVMSDEVLGITTAALDVLRGLGATVEPVSLPLVPIAMELMWALVMGEAVGYHRPMLRTRYDAYDVNTRTRLAAGAIMPHGVVDTAQRLRARLAASVRDAFQHFDVLASPVAEPAPPVAQGAGAHTTAPMKAPPTMQAFNLAGNPALSVPAGFSPTRLPVGLQLAGRAFEERTLFKVARAYEQAAPWYRQRPPLPA
jgi:aspartyl-tRNA(Asn)/glutamyl-tRNA(Gln) amidotransferase subunit A